MISVKGIDAMLMAHGKEDLIAAGTDWERLPDGPLRKAFEAAANETSGQTRAMAHRLEGGNAVLR